MAKTFLLSDGSVNSYGFRLDMEKINLDRFQANPVMLYNHWDLIGRWKNIELKDGKLTAEPEFMDDPDEPLSLKVKKRVEKGYLKGASLGIRILQKKVSAGEPPQVVAEVMEASIVDIPSNKNALALYDKNGQKLEGEAFHLALQSITEQQNKNKNMNKVKLSAGISQKTRLPQEVEVSALEAFIQKTLAEKDTLQNKLAAIEQEKIDKLIETALSEGRITADKKQQFINLAKQDFDLAKTTLETLPKAEKLSGKSKPIGKTLMDDRSDWTFADWRKKDTAGLLQIKRDDPELYAEILNKQ